MKQNLETTNHVGYITLAFRVVVGWTYFSALWRRIVLMDKLDPDTAGYIGEKFNHFLPNALGIKPIIQYLVENPDLLYWNMVIFTIIEGIVGLAIILGLFTRLMSIGVMLLALGILLASGWIGTTCLDEWQIGILGIAGGFGIFLSGGGSISLDHLLQRKKFFQSPKLQWLMSKSLTTSSSRFKKTALIGSILILGLTLFTNQYFHGGIWGDLHNKSIRPKLEITNAQLDNQSLSFTVYRVEGVDVYGSFLIGIELTDPNGATILNLNGEDLAQFPETSIHNYYVAKVKPGKHSLVIPLGAKADISIPLKTPFYNGNYNLQLTDISGLNWNQTISL